MRKSLRTKMSITAIGVLIASAPIASASAAESLQPIVLLPPQGYGHTWVRDINDDGITVGSATLPQSLAPARALRWDLTGKLTELDDLGGRYHDVLAINRRGDAAGHSARPDGYVHAVRWDAQAGVHDLGTLPGDGWSAAYDINDAGTVIGLSSREATQVDGSRAVRWDSTGRIFELEAPSGARSVLGWAINKHGEAVGTFYDSAGVRHGVRWDRNGRATVLAERAGDAAEVVGVADDGTAVGMLYSNSQRQIAVRWDRSGRFTPLSEEAQVLAISDRGGSIVGRLYAGGSQRWDYRHGRVVDLPAPADGASGSAVDVNDHVVAVGYYFRTSDSATVAVRWNREGRPTELPTPADHLRAWVQAVNNRGDVVGGSAQAQSITHAVLWRRR